MCIYNQRVYKRYIPPMWLCVYIYLNVSIYLSIYIYIYIYLLIYLLKFTYTYMCVYMLISAMFFCSSSSTYADSKTAVQFRTPALHGLVARPLKAIRVSTPWLSLRGEGGGTQTGEEVRKPLRASVCLYRLVSSTATLRIEPGKLFWQ